MRTLVIGDIHGGLRALHQIMERAKVTKEDTLIFLGDYVDGWSQSPQVLDYLIELNTTNNCVFIRGNHDELLLHWLETAKTILCGTSTEVKHVLAYEKVNRYKTITC
jgi:serine/threonine protein phosphatase 1